ncbi:MAG: UTP--glucose-1-phosphate uridylyltransferase GalU [Dehalococcoidia bacterium]|jgi:UTP--glucose-1-phosphate uridylyltransferase
MKVRKAVIVAAGWGTRFLPATRSVPKEMLPLVDKPVIQYDVEEALNSGIEQIIIITARGKQAMEDYFDACPELERYLEIKGDNQLLDRMRELSGMVDITYIRQKEQKGIGHAVNMAKDIVGKEPFAVMLPDDIIDSPVPTLKSMMDIYEKHNGGVIAVEKVGDEDTRKYGIIDPEPVSDRVYRILGMVEKPEPSEAPSRLGIVGRYILPPETFDAISRTPPGKNNEIQITDSIRLLLEDHPFYAYELEGTRFDTGNPLGWLKANVSLALKREDLGPELRKYLEDIL